MLPILFSPLFKPKRKIVTLDGISLIPEVMILPRQNVYDIQPEFRISPLILFIEP